MFAKIPASLFAFASVFLGCTNAIPLFGSGLAVRGQQSFNNYDGISTLSKFDNFYGSGNFANSQFSQAQITVVQEKSVVCHSQTVEIIQQRLLVIQEMAKRIITEQICEVETQTLVFEQFHASLVGFGGDLRRQSGRSVGYDSSIASHIGHVINSDGTLSIGDLGFTGQDLGKGYAVPLGNNWNNSTSPSSVGAAWKAASSAAKQGKQGGKNANKSSATSSSVQQSASGSASVVVASSSAKVTATPSAVASTSASSSSAIASQASSTSAGAATATATASLSESVASQASSTSASAIAQSTAAR